MNKSISLTIVIVLFIATKLNADCGCNKLNRNERKLDESELDNNIIESKQSNTNEMCSASIESQLNNLIHENDIAHNMALIPAGAYAIGTNEPFFPDDRESPERIVQVDAFLIDKYEVSNEEFEKFVSQTGYKTDAEKFGDSFVFKGLISDAVQEQYVDYRVASAPWWYKINGTSWKSPEGVGSNINDRMDHPVVHVSWPDAVAFCKWQNKRLPTEKEWEIACRGDKKQKLFPWGNKLNPKDQHWTNIWQGKFPDENTAEDGYLFTCPVNQFRQNDYHLYNIVGNVWEWTDTLWNNDPATANQAPEKRERVKKGGSYLCHASYCYRYRCAARSSNTEDSSAGNLGFRCAQYRQKEIEN